MPNGNHTPYEGTAFVVYRIQEDDVAPRFATDGTVVAMFSSRRSAEKYQQTREENDARHGYDDKYTIIPWVVQR